MFSPLRMIAVCLMSSALLSTVSAADRSWPGFRGFGDSHSEEANLPLTWSDEQNVVWTQEIPGYGQSSPVVWNDFAFVTGVKGENKETLIVACLKVETGELVWQKEFPASQTVKASDYVSRGAPTPLVDAKHVYAFFESGDLVALSHTGDTVWNRSLSKEYGEIQGNHGLGSSPAQTDEALIILADHSGPSYLVSIDKLTGKTVWKKDRTSRVSWSSPVVANGADGQEILISSNGGVQCFTAKAGDLLWEVNELKGNTVASPSVTPDAVLIGSSQPSDNVLIRRGGRGDVTATHVAWRGKDLSSSFGSPLVHAGRAYFVSKAGVAFAADLQTGESLWQQRMPDSTWASPLAVGERVYFFCKDGTTVVIKAANTFEKLAENKLKTDDRVYGVAVANGGFLIRSGSQLKFVRETEKR